jgi:hypothetical protein
MKLDNYMKEMKENFVPSNEMVDFFEERTKRHIDFVGQNLQTMMAIYPAMHHELSERITSHDLSKYGAEEFIPYVYLTWYHKMRNEGVAYEYPSQDVEDAIRGATQHHIHNNRHHPEFHANPHHMTEVDMIEMVCDWEAMSMELGGNTEEWANKNIGKWNFDKEHVKLIYMFIDDLS